MASGSVIAGRGSGACWCVRQLGGQLGFWDSIRDGSRVWEWHEGLGKLIEGALSAGLIGDVLIVLQLRGHE